MSRYCQAQGESESSVRHAVFYAVCRTCTIDWSEVALLDKRKMTLDAVTPRTLTLLATRCVKQPDE